MANAVQAVSRLRSPVPEAAQRAFPRGLERHSDHLWQGDGFEWSLAEQAALASEAPLTPREQAGAAIRHIEQLLGTVAGALRLAETPAPLVLSLSTPAGEAGVVSWLRLLDEAFVIASHPSGIRLTEIIGRVRAHGGPDRLMGVMARADEDIVAPGSVDLVSGVSCLHRLPDPDRALAAAARALRPGGHAIFLEPFDGFGLLRLAFERIGAEAALRDEPLLPGVRRALEDLASDIAARTLPDPSTPGFAELESRWLFGREALETAARSLGFSQVRFFPHNDHETLYRDRALLEIRAATGIGQGAVLPDWALEILDSFDRALRPPVKRLLMLEGTLVLTR